MLMIIFLLSYVGIKSAIWTNHAAISSFGISEKKLSQWCQLFAVFVSFFYFWFSISLFQVWIFIVLLVLSSPIFTFWLRTWRSEQIPQRCLREMDQILLNLKMGQSIRQALALSLQKETSWFRTFLIELQKGFELHSSPITESKWFNKWAHELMEIEKSRVKVVEQMEVIRRGIKVELDFKRKMKRVTDGPKMQAIFMSLLFLALNFLSFKSVSMEQMKVLIPISWVFFLVGIILSWSVVRLFRWKV